MAFPPPKEDNKKKPPMKKEAGKDVPLPPAGKIGSPSKGGNLDAAKHLLRGGKYDA